jgi:predicted Zn-dependent protease
MVYTAKVIVILLVNSITWNLYLEAQKEVKDKMNKILKKLFIFFVPFLFSCAINPVTGQQELMLLSEAQEIEIGKQTAPSANWEFGGEYNDPGLKSYLNGIVQNLWRNSERPHLPFKFHIQNTSIPNAFALPGYVAVTRGLLSDLENEAQFASIMGHEIGHVMARHTAQRLSRVSLQQLGLSLGGALLGGTKGADALLTAGSMSSLLLLKYDRGQELQADRLGVKYMSLLGYEPREALRAHELIEKSSDEYLKRLGKSRGEDSLISNILSTHPRKEVRLSEIQTMIHDLPPYRLRGDGKFISRFQTATKRMRDINRIYFNYDQAEQYYQKKNYSAAEMKIKEAINLNNGQAPFFNLLGLIKLQQKNYSEAQRAYERALSIDSGFQPSIYGRGLVFYFQKNYQSAISQFQRSLDLYPGHLGSYIGTGKSFFNLKNYRQAIPYLEKFGSAVPRHPEIHGLLGICYESIGNGEGAVREYRYQLQIAPNTDLGIYSRKRLAALGQI